MRLVDRLLLFVTLHTSLALASTDHQYELALLVLQSSLSSALRQCMARQERLLNYVVSTLLCCCMISAFPMSARLIHQRGMHDGFRVKMEVHASVVSSFGLFFCFQKSVPTSHLLTSNSFYYLQCVLAVDAYFRSKRGRLYQALSQYCFNTNIRGIRDLVLNHFSHLHRQAVDSRAAGQH